MRPRVPLLWVLCSCGGHWRDVSATSRWDPLGSRGLASGAMWEPLVEDRFLEKGHRPRQCGWRRERADLTSENEGELMSKVPGPECQDPTEKTGRNPHVSLPQPLSFQDSTTQHWFLGSLVPWSDLTVTRLHTAVQSLLLAVNLGTPSIPGKQDLNHLLPETLISEMGS